MAIYVNVKKHGPPLNVAKEYNEAGGATPVQCNYVTATEYSKIIWISLTYSQFPLACVNVLGIL